ncbi:MAG: hypothetical protein JWQ04_2836 [Pedosphaera sp.]|nr:hypothetical protein [Pedosphaera sp.]
MEIPDEVFLRHRQRPVPAAGLRFTDRMTPVELSDREFERAFAALRRQLELLALLNPPRTS